MKNPPAMRKTLVRSLGWEDSLEKGMATHCRILAGEFHGQKSLVSYRPKGHKELDTTEMTENSHMNCHQKFKGFTVFSVEITKKA